MAELLFAQDAVQVAKAATAQRFGHVQAIQAELFGFVVNCFGRVHRQGTLGFNAVFQRL